MNLIFTAHHAYFHSTILSNDFFQQSTFENIFFCIIFFLFFKFFIVESQQTKYFYPSTIVGDRFLITKCPSFYSTVILMNITRYQFFI